VNAWLVTAGVIALSVGLLHSWLGERLILIRLFRRNDLPHLFGSDVFTRRTLRFAWHLTSVAWLGFTVLLVRLAALPVLNESARATANVIAWTFLASSVLSLVGARGKHFSWVLFLAVAVAIWLGTGT